MVCYWMYGLHAVNAAAAEAVFDQPAYGLDRRLYERCFFADMLSD